MTRGKGSHEIRLRRKIGQHLLHGSWLNEIIRCSGISSHHKVLEIGAGPGNLTELLCARASRVVAVELDDRFAPKLAALRIRYPHLDVVIGDFLKIDLPEIASPAVSWTVVANIPYYITALIIEKLIGEGRGFIREAYLLVQEEVARRIVSRGGRESGAVSIYVQYHARPEIMMIVPPEAFSPPPMVRSALLHLSFLDAPPVEVREESFFTVVGIAFRSRRKMLRNSLAVLPWAPDQGEIEEALKAAGIDPRARPESLDLEDFARLSRSLDLPEIQPRL